MLAEPAAATTESRQQPRDAPVAIAKRMKCKESQD